MYMDMECGKDAEQCPTMESRHREYYAGIDSFEEQPMSENPYFKGFRWEVAPGCGVGFTELMRLNSGPSIGLCAYTLASSVAGQYVDYSSSLRFCIMLSGSFRMTSKIHGRSETIHGGDLWFSVGSASDAVHCSQPAGEFISGVSLEVSSNMLENWLGGATCDLSRSLEQLVEQRHREQGFVICGSFPKLRAIPNSHPVVLAAQRMLSTERRTLCGRLSFEARCLDFLSQALSIGNQSPGNTSEQKPQRQRAVEEAVCILGKEWNDPPTITTLARRVGVNECYLKTDFRRHTGLSIGGYVRKIRMERALDLIESSQCSVLQAATFVGYSNPSHFSRAFKRFHGYLPSACLNR